MGFEPHSQWRCDPRPLSFYPTISLVHAQENGSTFASMVEHFDTRDMLRCISQGRSFVFPDLVIVLIAAVLGIFIKRFK